MLREEINFNAFYDVKITVCWWKWLVFHFRLDVSSRCAITSIALDFELIFSTVSIIITELHGRTKPHSYVNLPILENLVITWPYIAWATNRPSPPQAQQYKITQSTGLATLNATGEKRMAAQTFGEKVCFSMLFLMFTLTWIKEKELGRRKC